MTELAIVGGVYHELCAWPDWDQIYGSGGRAAAAVSAHVDNVNLYSYAQPRARKMFEPTVKLYGFNFTPVATEQSISFEYIHCMSIPIIRPWPPLIKVNEVIEVSGDLVLRFGMMEGSARVDANRCVYDPQSATLPESFAANGSRANRLAIVANRAEISKIGDNADPVEAAKQLLSSEPAEVVVVKSGAAGAYVVETDAVTHIPAHLTDNVWTIGSGDVFAAAFALSWGVEELSAVEAAEYASRAVAFYVNSRSLPLPRKAKVESADFPKASVANGTVYLAGPFFSIGQRWLVDEVKRCLQDLGVSVFSPVHDVGVGPADSVVTKDIQGLGKCDAVLAILDGLDSGTLFEVGYARAHEKPVYAIAQSVSSEDAKMLVGTDCRLFDDLVTALHHVAWRT